MPAKLMQMTCTVWGNERATLSLVSSTGASIMAMAARLKHQRRLVYISRLSELERMYAYSEG